MKKPLTKVLDAIRDQLESWGFRAPRAGVADQGPRVLLFGPSAGTTRRIGILSQEGGEFVFRYDHDFAQSPGAEPLPAFPALDEEYRSRDLWPFFAVRIPPAERSDVRAALEHRGLRPEQTLEILAAVAKRSVSNPYRLELGPSH